MVWLRVAGLSFSLSQKPAFRDYVRGYEPRASFPHSNTLNQIAEAIDAIQTQNRRSRIAQLTSSFKGRPCVGLQLDMWTDSNTHTAFGCVIMTWVDEPDEEGKDGEVPQLWLRNEILDFNVFPETSKTGEAIKNWFVDVLNANDLPHSAVAGITPDGAADGQCGLSLIPTLSDKVDTCQLHVLQRAVLFSVGLAGATSKNAEAKKLLRKHNRVVALSRQSLAVGKSIREAQLNAKVPVHQLCSLLPTATTRWGNQYTQVSRNCELRAAVDPAVEKFKQDNRNNKGAIVESNESEEGSKAGKPVPASELGLNYDDWQQSQAFLSYPFDIKETIEHRPCTGAQALALLYDLKENFCDEDAGLSIKEFTKGVSVQDRKHRNDKSQLTTKTSRDLGSVVTTTRKVMAEELTDRVFHGLEDRRPSNARLIQAYMSKQMPSSQYLPEAWNAHARTLYLQALREAHNISRGVTRSSPSRAAKKPKAPVGGMLFRGAQLKPSAPDSPATAHEPNNDTTVDPVLDELRRWDGMGIKEYEKFIGDDGLLNEFAMMWALRKSFPLHYILFKQTACHLPHEANVEQIFSRAGLLSDPNLDPDHLVTLTKIGFNKFACNPSVKAIKDKYYELFRGKGAISEEATCNPEDEEPPDSSSES